MEGRPTPNCEYRPPEAKPLGLRASMTMPPRLPLDGDRRQSRAASVDGYLQRLRSSWGPESESRKDAGATMGQAVRRLSLTTSLDHSRMFPEELSRRDSNSSSVSDYQVTFQQMKQEHPSASLGALHQMTLARIAEVKAGRERRRGEQAFALEEERLRRQSPTEKALGRCLGKIRRGIQEHVEHSSGLGDSLQSRGSSSQHSASITKTASNDSILALIMPIRRPTGGSDAGSIVQSSAVAGEPRDKNLAPKKSVTELECDTSFRSLSSYGSGWTRISSKSKGDGEETDHDDDVPLEVKEGGDANHDEYDHDGEGAGAISSNETLRKDANDSTNCKSPYIKTDLIVGFTADREPSSPDNVQDFKDSEDLIVGFFSRSTSIDEEDWDDDDDDDDDGLIVGFGHRGNQNPCHTGWGSSVW